MTTKRWARRPEGSTWGDWGDDDEKGRANLLTPDVVMRGISEVKEGRAFCLSMPLDYPGGSVISPRRKPPELRPTLRAGNKPNMNYGLRFDDPSSLDVVCDDQVLLTLQYSTQWDTLAHIGQRFDIDGNGKLEDVFYNGFRANQDIVGPVIYAEDGSSTPTDGHKGAQHLGVENMATACMQGRGVMIDLVAHYGRTGKIIGYDELMHVIDTDRIEIKPGDFALFRTDFGKALIEMNKQPDTAKLFSTTSALDGRDDKLQQWITDSGVVALISDNYAVETMPARPCLSHFCAKLPLHAHCLFKLGCYLGEMWYLTELADWLRAHGRNSFLLTAPPLRLPGAVGSPVTPIATV